MWRHNGYDPCKGMSDDERMKAGCLQVVCVAVGFIAAMLICALFGSCTTTKYVPVTEQHTEHHWHTDSVKERDSVHTENTTIIREVDSAAMAKYGIQMQNNQRAWLVLQREMEQRLRELEHMTAIHDTIRDSIPVPVPVEVTKEVPVELTWWQQTRLHLANILLWSLLIVGIILIGKKHISMLGG
jgi:hypothetical protein